MDMTKIIHREGDIFTSDAIAIGHGVNTHGVMGHGIAVEFRKRWPEMYQDYRKLCLNFGLFPGGVFVWVEKGRQVLNIASQNRPGKDARIEWLEAGIKMALDHCDTMNIPVLALPRIGSGVGGLNAEDVEAVLEKQAAAHTCDIELWTLPE